MLGWSAVGVRGALLALWALLACPMTAPPVSAGEPESGTELAVSVAPASVARPAMVAVRVGGGQIARLHFITDGTVASDDWTVVGRTASGPMTWHSLGSRVVTVTVTLATGQVLRRSVGVTVGGPADVDPAQPRFQLVYLYPRDTEPIPGRAEGIVREAQVVDEWFAEQTGGLSPRFALDLKGRPSIIRLATTLTTEDLAQSGDVVTALMNRWRVEGAMTRLTVPIVYIEGRQTRVDKACAWYESPIEVIVLPIGNCGLTPASQPEFPYGSTAVLAHEIVHALGAMGRADGPPFVAGHTSDDPRDLMYEGAREHEWANLELDPNRDDYYLTGASDDIARSDLLERD